VFAEIQLKLRNHSTTTNRGSQALAVELFKDTHKMKQFQTEEKNRYEVLPQLTQQESETGLIFDDLWNSLIRKTL